MKINPLVLGHPAEPVIFSSEVLLFFFPFVDGFLLVCTVKFRMVAVSLQRLSLVPQVNFPHSAAPPVTHRFLQWLLEIRASQLLHLNASTATFQSELSAAISSRVRVTVNTETRSEMLPRISPPQRSMFVILCNKFIIKRWMASKSNLWPDVSQLNYFADKFNLSECHKNKCV